MSNIFATTDPSFTRTNGPAKPTADHRSDGTLILQLTGQLSRDGRYGGTSTEQLRQQLQTAATDTTVSRVVIRVDSPGGESAGAVALSDAVQAVAKLKPVNAIVENVAASAAYLAICKATSIVSHRGAMVGGIGTYAVIEDSSQLANAIGVKVHVIKAGEFKGMGVPGTTFTEEQQREVQRVVNSINDLFVSAVASGRKLTGDKIQIVTTGQVWIASDALRYSLIDSIGDIQSVLASPAAASAGNRSARNELSPRQDFAARLEAQQRQQRTIH